MKRKYIIRTCIIIMAISLFPSCEDFVDVPAPENKMVKEIVFNDDATARSAMTGIYNQLFLSAFSNGQRSSVTVLAGLSGDNIRNINTTNITRMQFEANELLPENTNNLDLWSSAYAVIYMTNSLLEGLGSSDKISTDLNVQLEGEARFIRAFTYFYLVNLYNDVPLILSTDYRENQLSTRAPISEVYEQIINDLQLAQEFLNIEYRDEERTQVNSYAARALLARVYLFLEDWEKAEDHSTAVIQAKSHYEILENLNEVFLANSREAIWQISPIGSGFSTHTNEGSVFIIDPVFTFLASFQLEEDFVQVFQEEDKRLTDWIEYHNNLEVYFSHKYKVRNSTDFPIEEYSMVLRLAEQYLIRAEARIHRGDLTGALEDLDTIRQRAGLDSLTETNTEIGETSLLEEIMGERRKELFTEWGHRWLDLKRTGKVESVIGHENPQWEYTDIWYPIPAEERMRNPNLTQNDGY
ncbi:RagB/SusD family nutrient uptake outer membrane protein [Zunongwangia sp. HRR-M8]|uniref:RagB/SusD family nutrient uptake outer membrane protein n=1 Tax=Zunongwangia sp. HRR-M8 TaxID=3015170 RepID=UPI0022DE28A0|nr:RagB/SusD family nutrient uptake outer membrane protein [Zunongwangia sp. HRR-M8]WBL22325.1 RagB/SusD family nutrient uptake outer membrane protein [Zunongwangia sp. HRR-M8]